MFFPVRFAIGRAMDEQKKQFNDALAISEAATVRRKGNLIAIIMKDDVIFDTVSSTVKPGLYTEVKRIPPRHPATPCSGIHPSTT